MCGVKSTSILEINPENQSSVLAQQACSRIPTFGVMVTRWAPTPKMWVRFLQGLLKRHTQQFSNVLERGISRTLICLD